MESKSHSKIVSSAELKRLFVNKCKKLGITPYEVVSHFGDDTVSFRLRYLENRSPVISDKINEGILLKYFEFVGIRVNMVIRDNKDLDSLQENVDIILEERRLRRIEKN